MPFDYKIEDGYVSVELHGIVTVADLFEMAKRYQDFELERGFTPHRVVDPTRAQEVRLDFNMCETYAASISSAKWKNQAKAAIVAKTPLHFGLARIFQTLAHNSHVGVRIFPNQEEALQWVREKETPSATVSKQGCA